MKNRFTIIFLLISLITFSQEKTKINLRKKSIKVKEFYGNGRLKEKGKKKLQIKVLSIPGRLGHGRGLFFKQGRWIEYYDNGKKKRIIVYDKGDIVKEVRKWNEDGRKN